MKYLILILTLILVSSCRVLTKEEAITVRKTIHLNNQAWKEVDNQKKQIIVKMNEEAIKLLDEALEE